MVYSFTIVVNKLCPYLLAVILLLYTLVGRHYPQFSLVIFQFAVGGADLKRGRVCHPGGSGIVSCIADWGTAF